MGEIVEFIDIENMLKSGNTIQIKPQGYSMYPLFVPGRDFAIITPIEGYERRLKRGDVVLYRRDKGILVLHRIWRAKKTGLYMVGDNQKDIEGPLRYDQVRGILIGIIRKDKQFSVNNFIYIILTRLWLILRPLRPFISHCAARVKRIFNKK